MTSQTKMLNDLIEKVSTDLGDVTTTERLFAQENAFAALVRSAPPRRRQRRILTVSAAATAAVCLLLWLTSFFSVHEIPFFIGNASQRGVIGRWEETPKGMGLVIAFAQGSRIDLREKTAARVIAADERKVQVTLRNGLIEPDIVGNGKTEWIVDAGPWRISVLGTHFTVDWRQEKDILEVAVTRGRVRVARQDGVGHSVEVFGGELFRAENGRPIVTPLEAAKNQSLSSDLADQRQSVSSADEIPSTQEDIDTENESSPESKASDNADETRENSTSDGDARRAHEGRGNRLEWLVHYANGVYDAALASADKYGIDKLIDQLDAVRLWKLQDAARITRRYDLSEKILHRFRERFPKDKNADVAGFLLGRIAMDKRQYAVAARWFNTYIAEAPRGPLAEEAHGLLIIVYEKTGQTDRARQAAAAYLDRYRGGAFAKIAGAHVRDR